MLAALLEQVSFLPEKHYAVLGRQGSYFPTKKKKKETLKESPLFNHGKRILLYDGRHARCRIQLGLV